MNLQYIIYFLTLRPEQQVIVKDIMQMKHIIVRKQFINVFFVSKPDTTEATLANHRKRANI